MNKEIQFDVFKKCFDESGLKKVDISRSFHISATAVQAWFDREKVPSKYLYPLAEILQVNPRFLIGEADNAKKMQLIPIVGKSDEAAVPSMPLLDGDFPTIERPYYGEDVYGVTLCGDEMSPTISSCATCLCDPHAEVKEGEIVHFSFGKQHGIRRYRLSADKRTIVLIGDNPESQPIFISWDAEEELKMVRVYGAELVF